MDQVPVILKRAADKAGLVRYKYQDRNTPTGMENICVMSFFGDMRSTCVASSLLLKRYKEEAKGSKYFILCSWPGYDGLFPFVDEYWTIKDESLQKTLAKEACGFENKSSMVVDIQRELNYFFKDVVDSMALDKFYHNGITQEFLDRFQRIKRYLPSVPSTASLGAGFMREMAAHPNQKVFIYPAQVVQGWRLGQLENIRTDRVFWVKLATRLAEANYVPVVYKNYATHDISADLTDKCIYVTDGDILNVLGAMRGTGLVLDVFSEISRLAIIARTPFLACSERPKYVNLKEFELDDLCGKDIPKQYIFAFNTILESDSEDYWDSNLFDLIIAKLNSFSPSLDRDKWPTTSEIDEYVLYSSVRKFKAKKFGLRFLKLPKSINEQLDAR